MERDEDIWSLRYVNQESNCRREEWYRKTKRKQKDASNVTRASTEDPKTRMESNQLKESGKQAHLHACTENQNFAGRENAFTMLTQCGQDGVSFLTLNASTATTTSPNGPYSRLEKIHQRHQWG
uniref:AlNc14C163G7836 protein n=1 Tax=Albugo laibachii Nc14 TaxID=890382 RepID=F0WMZ9_9STRA|nr:AlNc14C163G7836 [Albugo laibachii Nc14]|eukprot:CCA22686.1 AlNc14C163G7836 [Albugo laibachii Nc14]